jgi:hypothetical protein
MVSSGMLRRVALVRTDVSEELSAFIIRMTRISELGTTLAVTSNRRMLRSSPILVTLMKEALSSSETSVLTRDTRRNIQKDTILHSLRRENLKSYTGLALLQVVGSCGEELVLSRPVGRRRDRISERATSSRLGR